MGQDNSFLLFIGAVFLALAALLFPLFLIGALIAGYKGIKIMLHNSKIDKKSSQYVLVMYRLKDLDFSEKRYIRLYNLPELENLGLEENKNIDVLIRYCATLEQCKDFAKLNNLTIN